VSVFDRSFRLLLASASVACVAPPERTDPPQIAALRAAYEAPSGTVDPKEEQPWLVDADEQLLALGVAARAPLFVRIVELAAKAVDDANLANVGSSVDMRVDGQATIEIPCGAAAEARVHVEVTIDRGKLGSSLWGHADHCSLVGADFGGTFTLYRYPDGGLLVQLAGKDPRDDSPISVDYRILDEKMESRVVTPTGDVIAMRSGDELSVRARNGTFRCRSRDRSCR
jgi:hypothetical protein